jgi:hypothetical protein
MKQSAHHRLPVTNTVQSIKGSRDVASTTTRRLVSTDFEPIKVRRQGQDRKPGPSHISRNHYGRKLRAPSSDILKQ